MSSTPIERFRPSSTQTGTMNLDERGGYVGYSDYLQLAAQVSALKACIGSIRSSIGLPEADIDHQKVEEYSREIVAATKPLIWSSVENYNPEMGRVLVWLQWPPTLSPLAKSGGWVPAYQVIVTDESPVWVDDRDCMPIETTGRKVSHFMRPTAPETP